MICFFYNNGMVVVTDILEEYRSDVCPRVLCIVSNHRTFYADRTVAQYYYQKIVSDLEYFDAVV